MENVLIVSSNRTAAETLTAFIWETFRCNVRTAETAQQARGILSGNLAWELIMINLPLTDEKGLEFARFISENTESACMVFIKAEQAQRFMDYADRCNIIVVTKPFGRQVLYQIVKAVDIAIRRSWSLYEETVRLEKKLDEVRLVDKAKFRLMQYMGMTEDEAHSYLEQYAMKNRKKKVIAASEIIDKINEQYL